MNSGHTIDASNRAKRLVKVRFGGSAVASGKLTALLVKGSGKSKPRNHFGMGK